MSKDKVKPKKVEKGFITLRKTIPLPKGWVCPKCDYVWGPGVGECYNCNQEGWQFGGFEKESETGQ